MGNVHIYTRNGIEKKARKKVIIMKKLTTASKRKIGIENNPTSQVYQGSMAERIIGPAVNM